MININQVTKSFGNKSNTILHDISFDIPDGDFISLTGKSGSGKSTLLYIISSLDFPSSGEIVIDGFTTTTVSSEKLHAFRNTQVGFVFQFHYLLPELSAIENILLPATKTHSQREKLDYAYQLMETLQVAGKKNHLPSQLSGGEQQRVAIARALIMNPRYLFADEPTGNLDSTNGEIVMNMFRKVNVEQKTTIVYVTHDPDFAKLANRQIVLVDGRCQ